jgi:hypothetical protein
MPEELLAFLCISKQEELTERGGPQGDKRQWIIELRLETPPHEYGSVRYETRNSLALCIFDEQMANYFVVGAQYTAGLDRIKDF